MVRKTRITPAILRTQTLEWLVTRHEQETTILSGEEVGAATRIRSTRVRRLVRAELSRRKYDVALLDLSAEDAETAEEILQESL